MRIDIGSHIKELRKQNRWSQTQLAEKLRTTQDTVSLWELGKSYPDLESVVLLCQVFEVSADYLLNIAEI